MAATGAKKPVRVWVDGCFDMMHFGHANAMRQVYVVVEPSAVACVPTPQLTPANSMAHAG